MRSLADPEDRSAHAASGWQMLHDHMNRLARLGRSNTISGGTASAEDFGPDAASDPALPPVILRRAPRPEAHAASTREAASEAEGFIASRAHLRFGDLHCIRTCRLGVKYEQPAVHDFVFRPARGGAPIPEESQTSQ